VDHIDGAEALAHIAQFNICLDGRGI